LTGEEGVLLSCYVSLCVVDIEFSDIVGCSDIELLVAFGPAGLCILSGSLSECVWGCCVLFCCSILRGSNLQINSIEHEAIDTKWLCVEVA
jgi:hypothetical protein